MSKNHSHENNVRSSTLTLPEFEAHFASVCVAIVFGTLGGKLAMLGSDYLSMWVVGGIALVLGFLIPWFICKYPFHTAHEWYGASSIAHRIYDSIGIVAALVVFVLRYWQQLLG